MIDVAKVWQALAAKEHLFKNAIVDLSENISIFEQAQDTLTTLPLAEIDAKLSQHAWPGASPTKEFEIYPSLIVPSTRRWENQRKNREWAVKKLSAQPTCAISSFQLDPNRNTPFLTALVQLSWFENPHLEAGKNIKDLGVEIFSPDELALMGDRLPLNDVIQAHRFVKEIDRLCQYMESKARINPKPICFFDGSFIVSFVQDLHPEIQVRYIDAVKKLLNTSEKTRVPIIGYGDDSYARDVIRMLSIIFGLTGEEGVSDGVLLDRKMRGWGDRSQVFQCSREDHLQGKDFYHQVYFTYLKTSEIMPPARIEFPAWIFEEGQHLYEHGLHNHMLDIVRAECVVGLSGSYPLALETAVTLAALTLSDQKDFHRIVQAYTHAQNLKLHAPSKIPI